VCDPGPDQFAGRFAAAGYAALAFDYRHFGASGGATSVRLARRQREDWRAAQAHPNWIFCAPIASEALAVVAAAFGVRRHAVTLVAGTSNRTKVVDVAGADPAVLDRLFRP